MSVWSLSFLFVIPFLVFVVAPKLGPVFRKLQRFFRS